MRIEWFQNNMPLKSGSRFMETNSFGFVALDIMYAYPEDAGTYTCRASNALGQAVTSCQLSVHSKKSIVRETQNQTALSQIQYLEDASRQQRPSDVEDSTTQVKKDNEFSYCIRISFFYYHFRLPCSLSR
jgi:hypothetical protein